MSRLVEHHPIIDDTLALWSAALGPAQRAYRGHVYRVFNFARHLLGSSARDEALAVSSVFHDLGIWSDGTFDYLPPSIDRAREYLREHASDVSAELVADVIDNHHRLGRVKTSERNADVVEPFRRADLVDVSRGLLRASVDRGFHREAVAAFPYAGFHGVLVRTGLAWFVRHPLRPVPMLRLTAPARLGSGAATNSSTPTR